MTSLQVTAAQSGATNNGIALTVKVITGQAASPIGKTGTSNTVTVPELAITPNATGSYVYGAVCDLDDNYTFTAATGTTFTQNINDATNFGSYGTFRSTSLTTASTPVTLGASAPTAQPANTVGVALVEILKGTGLAEDASSPAVASTTSATTITTAAFTPPAGSLLVAMVSSNGGDGANNIVTVSDSSGLTWTDQAVAALPYDGFTFQVAAVWTAQVPGGGGGGGSAPAPLLVMGW